MFKGDKTKRNKTYDLLQRNVFYGKKKKEMS